MNYHIEGVFHAEKSKAVKDMWWVWSDLTQEETESVQGATIDNERSHPLYGRAICVDPRFNEDKVLGKLMELAQQKHDKQYPKHKVYFCGDMHTGSHKFHIACDPAMDKDKVKVITVCHLGDVVDQVKVITYNGKLYYLEGEAGPGQVVVKREDLEQWRKDLTVAWQESCEFKIRVGSCLSRWSCGPVEKAGKLAYDVSHSIQEVLECKT
jgi:hypothetical protein